MSALIRSTAQILFDLGLPNPDDAKTHATPAARRSSEGDAPRPVVLGRPAKAAFGEYDSIDQYLRRRS